jgi:hypothetical protein
MDRRVKLAVILAVVVGVVVFIVLPVVPFSVAGSVVTVRGETSMSCMLFGYGMTYSNTLGMGWSNGCSDPHHMGWGMNGNDMMR